MWSMVLAQKKVLHLPDPIAFPIAPGFCESTCVLKLHTENKILPCIRIFFLSLCFSLALYCIWFLCVHTVDLSIFLEMIGEIKCVCVCVYNILFWLYHLFVFHVLKKLGFFLLAHSLLPTFYLRFFPSLPTLTRLSSSPWISQYVSSFFSYIRRFFYDKTHFLKLEWVKKKKNKTREWMLQ